MEYKAFLKQKLIHETNHGFDIDLDIINPILFDFQKLCVRWAIKKGKAALFEACGLGKTFQQLEWLRIILNHFDGSGLIICPLSVANQTIREGQKIDINLEYITDDRNIKEHQIYITNYERLKDFGNYEWQAIVLDESSILKSIGGKIKDLIFDIFKAVSFKLSCTATPSPNDITELANQAQFLDIMKREEMLAKFFVHDDNGWRLKKHAKIDFYKWLATWAVYIRKPSDIACQDNGFILPNLNIEAEYIETEFVPEGELFPKSELKGITDRIQERKKTIDDKLNLITDLLHSDNEQWLVWCGLNEEANKLNRKLNGTSKQVKGDDFIEYKINTLKEFQDKELKILITKPKIAGHGMNFQNAHNMAFVGLNDSWEDYYQCIRRCWRFGQKKPVNVKIILTKIEQAILKNVQQKEKINESLINEVVKEMDIFMKQELQSGHIENEIAYQENMKEGKNWKMYLGDSIEVLKKLDNNMIHLSIYSPPFASLYTYSPSSRDMGNSESQEQFWEHYDFMIPDLLRTTKEGRLTAVHCSQIPAMLVRDGYIGLKDFRGDLIRHYIKGGWIYHGEIVIDKNPQAQAIRTHSKGLTFTQLEKDSSWMRPALGDYILLFRKPGENQELIHNGNNGEISREEWIKLAHPIWYDIRETDTLNYRVARANDDERHICPLQLQVIENCLKLWSNPGEIILSPFAGIGSEGYEAIKHNRKFIGIELKEEYFNVAVNNLKEAENKLKEESLF